MSVHVLCTRVYMCALFVGCSYTDIAELLHLCLEISGCDTAVLLLGPGLKLGRHMG
jgi:hypothetical protein